MPSERAGDTSRRHLQICRNYRPEGVNPAFRSARAFAKPAALPSPHSHEAIPDVSEAEIRAGSEYLCL
jgi:hypothetical protein